MALKPEDMQQPVEVADMDMVNQLEQEMDGWLANQPKGQREYTNSWEQEDYTVPIRTADLEELAGRYRFAGWNVEYAAGHGLATMTLKRPIVLKNPIPDIGRRQMDRSVPFIHNPVIGSPQQPMRVEPKDPPTGAPPIIYTELEPAKLPED